MNKNYLVVPKKTKLDATLNSRNFWVSMISLIFLALAGNGANIVDPDAVSGEIYDAITNGQVGTLVSVLFINFINPLIKIVRQKTWSWNFVKSMNFWVQFLTVGLIGLTALGLVFPEGAASNIVETIFGGSFETIALTFVINVINPLYHFFFDKKQKEELIPLAQALPGSPLQKVKSNKGKTYQRVIPVSLTDARKLAEYIKKQKGYIEADGVHPSEEMNYGQTLGALRVLNTLMGRWRLVVLDPEEKKLLWEDYKK